ncbi:hypothetical protein [Cryptosporangium arvum]|uniref:Intracellular proteinase inhibitor BsuPI domain-containing protein n=1 Tax=Cryptosporangium arvum DSM 44712 TaxID=927661 RepID=A0A010ZQB6_9ACTN|nr:hypothetical protein [Cryptosporangium arvum]EXG79397.1 hypothetical protein CryarDRAFT_0432 [Cryptosporangium arvum DSM 44712]
MNWTVGPHPSSVYWRRRLLLLVPLLLVLLVAASCLITSGSSGDKAQIAGVPKSSAASPAGGASPTDPGESGVGSAGASPSQESPDSATAAPEAPEQPAGGSTSAAAACPDSALTVTAVPSDGAVRIGEFASMKLTVKNTSNAACRRDVGSNEQELKILSGPTKVWSSDDCSSRADASAAKVDRKIVPGETLNYFIKWGGTSSSKNCVTGAPVKPGKYQLVARLGTLESKPAAFTVSP